MDKAGWAGWIIWSRVLPLMVSVIVVIIAYLKEGNMVFFVMFIIA